jgi:hypothetical protein
MKARTSNKSKEQPHDDNYLARIVQVTRLGLQPGFLWQNELTDDTYKVELTYELVTTNMADGRPFWVSEEVTDTDNEKGKLYQRCLAAGVATDAIDQLINKPVMISTKQNEKGYAKIKNVAGVPGGIPVPDLRNPTSVFDIYSTTPMVDDFNSFPEFKRNKITSALDFKETALYKALAEDATDDLPF